MRSGGINRPRMNAMSLYIAACRCAMQAQASEPESWSELHRLLPLAHQALSCCVCTHILRQPMGPLETVCQHHVCKSCVGGKMKLKPVCGWCRDHETFEEKPVLTIVVQCFRKLCEYLAASPLAEHLAATANGGTNNILSVIQSVLSTESERGVGSSPMLFNNLLPGVFHPPRQINNDINEANLDEPRVRSEGTSHTLDANTQTERLQTDLEPPTLEREYDIRRPVAESSLSDTNGSCENNLGSERMISSVDKNKQCKEDRREKNEDDVDDSLKRTVAAEHDYPKDNTTMYSVTLMNDINPKLKIRRTPPSEYSESESSSPKKMKSEKSTKKNYGKGSSSRSTKNPKPKETKEDQNDSSSSSSSKKEKLVGGCRCGTATPNPGKLTCCGQRCPCYSAYKGCTDCRCRGCRNPRQDGMTPPPHIILQQQSILQIQNKKKDESGGETDVDIDEV